jgi:hypothetical protein
MFHSISALIKEIGKELTCIGEKINDHCTLKWAGTAGHGHQERLLSVTGTASNEGPLGGMRVDHLGIAYLKRCRGSSGKTTLKSTAAGLSADQITELSVVRSFRQAPRSGFNGECK